MKKKNLYELEKEYLLKEFPEIWKVNTNEDYRNMVFEYIDEIQVVYYYNALQLFNLEDFDIDNALYLASEYGIETKDLSLELLATLELQEKLKLWAVSIEPNNIINQTQEVIIEPKVYLGNAFSLQMLTDLSSNIATSPISPEHAKAILKEGFVSAIGHESTAKALTKVLGLNVEMNRINVKLNKKDVLIVAQYNKGRIDEGTILNDLKPEDFVFINISVEYYWGE